MKNNNIIAINESIHKITTPYKGIFTTVCTVSTQEGVLLFDSASFDEDVQNYILPMLNKLEITKENLKYLFMSHGHEDHAGGVGRAFEAFSGFDCFVSFSGSKRKIC